MVRRKWKFKKQAILYLVKYQWKPYSYHVSSDNLLCNCLPISWILPTFFKPFTHDQNVHCPKANKIWSSSNLVEVVDPRGWPISGQVRTWWRWWILGGDQYRLVLGCRWPGFFRDIYWDRLRPHVIIDHFIWSCSFRRLRDRIHFTDVIHLFIIWKYYWEGFCFRRLVNENISSISISDNVACKDIFFWNTLYRAYLKPNTQH